MKHRPASRPPPEDFPVDPWMLVERGFSPDRVPVTETLFALSNGFLGIRGVFEEGQPVHAPDALINGFHETWPITYPEASYGLPAEGQAIVGVPDATAIVLHIDGEPMRLSAGLLVRHERRLDLRRGVLEREVEWQSPGGLRLLVRTQRLVSFLEKRVAAFSFEVEVLSGSAHVTLSSRIVNRPVEVPRQRLDPREGTSLARRLQSIEWTADGHRLTLSCQTQQSGRSVACGAEHRVRTNAEAHTGHRAGPDEVCVEYSFAARPGSTFGMQKYVAYHVSEEAQRASLFSSVERTLEEVVSLGFNALLAAQEQRLGEFWERADIQIEGDPAAQQAVRWNLFQLAQATLRADGQGIPAKGLTGRGYDGHYFWDTELYLLPFLVHAYPRLARDLLKFRYGMLDAARQNARMVEEEGALFPWRTINGQEASAYYWAGTAQYHINADIAYALRKYVESTGDDGAMTEFGAEIMVETARLWTSLGFHSREDGAFHIHGVTGPDEYTAVVDDNTYTNLMARENLLSAVEALDSLRHRDPARYEQLCQRLDLSTTEPEAWRRAAEQMLIPFDDGRGIHAQDAHFLEKEAWDFAATPADSYPLLLHYHPLVIYRFQVLKQADVVLAMLLLPDRFTGAQRRANFDYYEPITTGDSSLSHAVQSMMAAQLGEHELALEHFGHVLYMDLGNWAGNAEDGVHIASAAGVWQAIIYGFAGLRDQGDLLRFDPHLPGAWGSLQFSLHRGGHDLSVRLTGESITLSWSGNAALPVTIRGEELTVAPGSELEVPLN